MDRERWGCINGVGNIYIDEELVVGSETILFTCEDDMYNKYLFMTYDSYEGEYVYIKLKKAILIDMLEKRITIEKVYRDADKIYMTYGDIVVSGYDGVVCHAALYIGNGQYYR